MVGSGELGLHWEGSDGGFGGAVSSGCFKWKSVLRSLWEAGEGLSTSLARRAGVLWSFCFMWFWGPHLAVLEARFSRVLGDRPAVLGIQQKCPGWRALAESMKQLSGASLTYLVDCQWGAVSHKQDVKLCTENMHTYLTLEVTSTGIVTITAQRNNHTPTGMFTPTAQWTDSLHSLGLPQFLSS